MEKILTELRHTISKKTQLNDIEVSQGEEHIMPVSKSSPISTLLPIALLYEEFTNFKIFVCQELNFMKEELSDVKQNKNKSDSRNCCDELDMVMLLVKKLHCVKAIALFCYNNITTHKKLLKKFWATSFQIAKVKTVKRYWILSNQLRGVNLMQ